VLVQSETSNAQAAAKDVSSTNAAEHSLINSIDAFYIEAKSMNVWYMLRDMVGETALIAALHNYKAADDNRTDYMQKLIQAQAHRDLEWFFDDWVYRDRGLPDFRIVSVYPRQLATGGYMITVTIENLGTAAAEVPVTLKMAASEASARLIVPAKSTESIRIPTPAMPVEAVVNDGSVPQSDVRNNTFRISSESQ
jgi:aminopeptidase N